MKREHRVSTGQFEYVNIELDSGEELTDEMLQRAVLDQKRATEAFQGAGGLLEPEWRKFLVNLITESGANHVETLELLSPYQSRVMQDIKKTMDRITYKERKEHPDILKHWLSTYKNRDK